MGKFEVLDFLNHLRRVGDDRYYRYEEVHSMLRSEGQSFNYTSVWRTLNVLACDGLVEFDFETRGLQRIVKFRGRV